MQVYFLGTGTSQGIPVIGSNHPVCKSADPKDKRLRVSVWITWEDNSVVIDCGPDFRQQMLRENVKQLDAVLFTHEHKDHTGGFDDIRAFNFIQQKEMDVYASERVQQALRRDYAYIFSDFKYPGIESAAIVKPLKQEEEAGGGGSTDVGDVSWTVPTVGLRAATWIPGTPAHSWQATACGGTDIGAKGMMVAAKTMALTAIDLFTTPALIEKAKEEFIKDKGDYQYKALLGDRKPALNYRD